MKDENLFKKIIQCNNIFYSVIIPLFFKQETGKNFFGKIIYWIGEHSKIFRIYWYNKTGKYFWGLSNFISDKNGYSPDYKGILTKDALNKMLKDSMKNER